jgi:hypothetical protein
MSIQQYRVEIRSVNIDVPIQRHHFVKALRNLANEIEITGEPWNMFIDYRVKSFMENDSYLILEVSKQIDK